MSFNAESPAVLAVGSACVVAAIPVGGRYNPRTLREVASTFKRGPWRDAAADALILPAGWLG